MAKKDVKPEEAAPAASAAELTLTGDAEAPPATSAETATPAAPEPVATLRSLLTQHSEALLRAGKHREHSVLYEVILAAGALREKTAAARNVFDGDVRTLIDSVHTVL